MSEGEIQAGSVPADAGAGIGVSPVSGQSAAPAAGSAVEADPGFFLVGVGASAGGLEALGKFFASMPVNSGLAFVVVQHLSPDHKSFMVELLSRKTDIPVNQAVDGAEVRPNHIYLIPPKRNLKISNGRLLLIDPAPDRIVNLSIDVFFRSVAEDFGHRAIGVVLSGTGSDGTVGIRAIKDAGGMVMAQSEQTAQFDGMPRSAISTGLADFVLPPEDMGQQLVQYTRHPFALKEQALSRDLSATEHLMQKIFSVLRERCGVDFSNYKASTIDRRIERRMSINQIENLADYYRYLESSSREADMLFNEFLICVTRFFRDPEVFEFLREEVIGKLIQESEESRVIRVWIPGCSTGEEPYSLAMLLNDEVEKAGVRRDIKIFATDISSEAVEAGSMGHFAENQVAGLSPEYLRRYFEPRNNGFQVRASLRKMVVFARHDLLEDPPFTRLDMITCRNVLIYFNTVLQNRVLSFFRFGLRERGILLLGSSENVGEFGTQFRPLSIKHKVFQAAAGKGEARSIGTHSMVPRGGAGIEDVKGQVAQSRRRPESRPTDAVERVLIADYVPPAIVVDVNNEIRQIIGEGGRYLKHTPGDFTGNVLKLTGSTLSTALAVALHRVNEKNPEFFYDNVELAVDGQTEVVRLRVKFAPEGGRDDLRKIIVFERPTRSFETDPDEESSESFRMDAAGRERIEDLEAELSGTRESLQATIEELETTNEELQAANEELLASNEELQSTNEELQSVNEELHTVNMENESRIEELVQLSNDINNLLRTSSVGTMLVDKNLRIRRISSAIEDMIQIGPDDVGAPLELVGRLLEFPEVIRLSQNVLDSGTPLDREVHIPGGGSLLLRWVPYEESEGVHTGLVLTLIDISALGEAALQSQADPAS